MGLDMYLNGKIYLSAYDKASAAVVKIIHEALGLHLETNASGIIRGSMRVDYIIIELAYFSKQHLIDKLFMDVVQEDGKIKLEDLYDIGRLCAKALVDGNHTEFEYEAFRRMIDTIKKIDEMTEKPVLNEIELYYESDF